MNDDDLLIILPEEEGERLDKVLAKRFTNIYSRSYLQYLIEQNKVLVNGEIVKKRYLPKADDEIQIQYILTEEIDLEPEDIPLDIVYEDDHILVINKPAGMVIHPAVGHPKHTFVNALLFHCKNLIGSDTLRPGIVHRLDKDTSGLLIAAKTTLAHQKLIEMFSSRSIYKEYLAICHGIVPDQTLTTLIGRHPVERQKMAVLQEKGKTAISSFKTLTSKENISLIRVVLQTGRTHQIRVHLQYLHTPILGDAIYGSQKLNQKFKIKRQLLHAYLLRFNHPITNQPLEFKAEVPSDMKAWIEKINH